MIGVAACKDGISLELMLSCFSWLMDQPLQNVVACKFFDKSQSRERDIGLDRISFLDEPIRQLSSPKPACLKQSPLMLLLRKLALGQSSMSQVSM